MPKMKTNSSAAKRFRRTASGDFKRNKSHRRHILTKKSSKRIRQLRSSAMIHESDKASLKKMLPYS
jgi:large subunit ribosomal protein L35